MPTPLRLPPPDKLRAQVEGKWLQVVKRASVAAIKVTLYGYEVFPKGDPSKVLIPWALNDDLVKSLPAQLKEPVKKE